MDGRRSLPRQLNNRVLVLIEAFRQIAESNESDNYVRISVICN
jgi:hypothetical protein